MKKKLKESIDYINDKGIKSSEIGIILGTGLGGLVENVNVIIEINYDDIPHFPVPTSGFHKGRIIYGVFCGKKTIIFDGRFHLYEGFDFFQITYPIRIMEMLMIKQIIISNAAGALNNNFRKGELMLIKDHINLQGGSPLAIKNIKDLGERFVDMSQPYDKKSMLKIIELAKKNKINLHHGVYAAVVGPQLETAAEYKYLKIIGADAVGMSTVPEVIVANQLRIPIIAFSVLTDECNPNDLKPIDIGDIMKMAKKAEKTLVNLLIEYLKNK